jgi:hypothetical protein
MPFLKKILVVAIAMFTNRLGVLYVSDFWKVSVQYWSADS